MAGEGGKRIRDDERHGDEHEHLNLHHDAHAYVLTHQAHEGAQAQEREGEGTRLGYTRLMIILDGFVLLTVIPSSSGIDFHGVGLREDLHVRTEQHFHTAGRTWNQDFPAEVRIKRTFSLEIHFNTFIFQIMPGNIV